MSVIDVVSQRFLKIAAARWPADIRDDQAREWAGELYAIRHDDERGRLRRRWAQLRFAFSLAASPPVEEPNHVPKGWRETMHQFGRAMRRVLMLVAVGIVCVYAPTGSNSVNLDVADAFRNLIPLLLFTALLCEAGRRVGRYVPLRSGPGIRGDSTAAVVAVLACPGMVMAIIVGYDFEGTDRSPIASLPYLVWVVGFAVLLAFVFRTARRGLARRAWWWALGGGFVLFEFLAVPFGLIYAYLGSTSEAAELSPSFAHLSQLDVGQALLWFPQSLIGYYGESWAYGGIPVDVSVPVAAGAGVSAVVPGLLAATAFAAGYLISSGRVETESAANEPETVAAVAETESSTAAAGARPGEARRRHLGLAAAVIGVLTWAFVLGVLTPVNDRDAAVGVREVGYWAIVLAALGLAWARSTRPWPVISGVAFAACALVANVIVDRANLTGFGAFLLVAGIGGALAVAAWLTPALMEPRHTNSSGQLRVSVAIAVFAGYSAPAALTQARFNGGWAESGFAGEWLPVVGAVVSLSLIGLAVVATASARDPRLSARAAVLILGVPVLAVAVIAWLTQYSPVMDAMPLSAFALGPVVVYLVAVFRWSHRGRGIWSYFAWGGGILVSGAAIVALFLPQLMVGVMIGDLLIAASAPDVEPASGAPMAPGLLLGAAVVAMFFSWWIGRGPRPRRVTATTDGTVTGGIVSA